MWWTVPPQMCIVYTHTELRDSQRADSDGWVVMRNSSRALLLCSSSLRPFCVFIAAAPNERKRINATNSRSCAHRARSRQGVRIKFLWSFLEAAFEGLRFAKCVRDLTSVVKCERGFNFDTPGSHAHEWERKMPLLMWKTVVKRFVQITAQRKFIRVVCGPSRLFVPLASFFSPAHCFISLGKTRWRRWCNFSNMRQYTHNGSFIFNSSSFVERSLSVLFISLWVFIFSKKVTSSTEKAAAGRIDLDEISQYNIPIKRLCKWWMEEVRRHCASAVLNIRLKWRGSTGSQGVIIIKSARTLYICARSYVAAAAKGLVHACSAPPYRVAYTF
jgi:hypothetical protein